ncbi:hypothetical protein [Demequina sp. NBRC 110052]|uniref:hypothetical protein n=1 Tax=Demequina sp. NBRC 110052 TaxID=1570341 RepID=UPI00117C530F|nr:hypothetical protein [Demequina sp. NBRC 110052]
MTIPPPADDGTFYPDDSAGMPEDPAEPIEDRWGTPEPLAPAPRAGASGPGWAGVPQSAPGSIGPGAGTSTAHNGRNTLAMVLSAVAAVGVAAWFLGVSVPLLLIVGLGIAGFSLGIAGYLSGRRGFATNGGLGAGAAALGAVAVLGVVAIYAIVLAAIGQILGG